MLRSLWRLETFGLLVALWPCRGFFFFLQTHLLPLFPLHCALVPEGGPPVGPPHCSSVTFIRRGEIEHSANDLSPNASASPWEVFARPSQVFNLQATWSNLVRFRITVIPQRRLQHAHASETILSFAVLRSQKWGSTAVWISSASPIKAWPSSCVST